MNNSLSPSLTPFAALVGTWRGTSRLHDPHTNAPEDSPSTLIIVPVVGGTFLRIDYTWSYQGAGQEGSLLLGGEPEAKTLTAHWTDTWHFSHKVMACGVTAHADGRLVLNGSYPFPPGPDWGWRIELQHDRGEKGRLTMQMTNVSPEGHASPAVEASYALDRAATQPTHQPGDLGQVAMTVNDVPAALAFYRDVLGLQFLFSPSPQLAFVRSGQVRLMLTQPQGAGTAGHNSILYFHVKDIESTFQAMVKRGARVERAPQLAARLPDHDLWIGFLRDPEDNLLGIMEEKSQGR